MSATQCRACSARSLSPVLDLGLMPPSRRFLTPDLARLPEPIYPLRLRRCDACGLLQLEQVPGLELPPAATDGTSSLLDNLRSALAADSVAAFELPNLLRLHDELGYDLICHETRCYFSTTMIAELLARHGIELIDAVDLDEQPGWLRLAVQRRGGPRAVAPAVANVFARERKAELHRAETWADFALLVEQGRDMLGSELEEWQYRRQTIVAYSSGGRGMTMLSFCGAAALRMPYLVDECTSLHGLLTPGHRIPIVDPERLITERPEAVLLLGSPWSADGNGPLHDYWRGGGRVLLPLPKPHYAEPATPCLTGAGRRDTIVPGLSFSEFA